MKWFKNDHLERNLGGVEWLCECMAGSWYKFQQLLPKHLLFLQKFNSEALGCFDSECVINIRIHMWLNFIFSSLKFVQLKIVSPNFRFGIHKPITSHICYREECVRDLYFNFLTFVLKKKNKKQKLSLC